VSELCEACDEPDAPCTPDGVCCEDCTHVSNWPNSWRGAASRKCYRCGKDPAEGYAAITVGGVTKWYCHGDDDEVSCYEVKSFEVLS